VTLVRSSFVVPLDSLATKTAMRRVPALAVDRSPPAPDRRPRSRQLDANRAQLQGALARLEGDPATQRDGRGFADGDAPDRQDDTLVAALGRLERSDFDACPGDRPRGRAIPCDGQLNRPLSGDRRARVGSCVREGGR
jgi:hypothetical protein